MKSVRVASVLLGLLLARLMAIAAPGIEAWLPKTTVAVFAVPDMNDARARFEGNPWYRLWRDPAMQAFRDHTLQRLRADWLDPFREQAGWDLRAGATRVEGPLAVALLDSGETPIHASELEWLVLADLGSQTGVVREFMESRWPASASTPNAVPVQEADGLLLRSIPAPGLTWISGTQAPARLWVGLTNNWMIAGTRSDEVVGVVRRLRGSGTAGLIQNPDFARDYQRSLRGSTVYGWVALRPLIGALLQLADAADAKEPAEGAIPMPPKRQMLEASGLTAVTSLTFALKESEAGTRTELAIAAPTSLRRGLLKMMELGVQDASPPPYVGTDVVRFDRLRINFRQTWGAFQQWLTELFPQAANVLDLLFKTAGPEGESRDLRDALLALLGDDLVRCEYAPTSAQPEALAHPPGLTRLSSTNAVQLALSLKALAVLLPPPLNEVNSESWQNHTLYSVSLPQLGLDGGGNPADPPLIFSALADSVAFSSDRALLQSFLAGDRPEISPLSALPGLSEASQEVGGTSQGSFRYYNLARAMPWKLTALKRQSSLWPNLLQMESAQSFSQGPLSRMSAWFDPRLLPPFENIAEYFGFSVAAAGSDAEHLFYRTFWPRPSLPASPQNSTAQGPSAP